MKANEQQFEAYIKVRNSGKTNMWDVAAVIELADLLADVRLTREQCLDIMHNFDKYQEAYPDVAKR